MKTICWSNLAFLVLAAIYCPAQTTVAARSRTAAPVAVAAAAAVLEVTSSNAVQAVTRVRLQNQASRSAGAPRAATVVTFQGVSSNAMQVAPRVQLQNPALPATRMSVAGAQTRGLTPLTATIPACVRPPGLVGWWPGEGDASDIVGGNAGTLQNGATCDTGEVGLAFSFNGDSQAVEIPYSTALATNCYSVEAWIQPCSQVDDPTSQALIFGQSYGRCLLVVRPGTVGLTVAFLFAADPYTFYEVDSDGEIPIGDWTHLVGTWDGTTLSLYINGDLNAYVTPGAVPWDSGCAFHIGGFYDPEGDCAYVGQFFNGLVDEVTLYSRALLHGEINALYLAGSVGKCKAAPACASCPANAAAWWPGECSASDIIGSNAGTLQNGATCAAGKVGQAFTFNGDSQAVEIPYSTNLVTPCYSVEAWIQPFSQVDDPINQALIFGQSYGRCLLAVRTGTVGLTVAFEFAADPYTFYEVASDGEIPIGDFTHLVGTWDGTTLSLYINGELDAYAMPGAVPWDSGCAFHIGGFYDPEGDCAYVGQFFNGLVDEVTVYSRALSDGEIRALSNAASAGKCFDSDNDGLPDWWEIKYFGNLNQGANADPDGDGLVNFLEYLLGTNPTVAAVPDTSGVISLQVYTPLK